jgi:ABC-type transport system substrate-binding protein
MLLVGLAALAGCSSSKENGPPRGGTLRLTLSDVPDLNPWTSVDPLSTPFLVLLYEGLVRLDSSGTIQPALAESWSVSDDSLSFSFRLQPGRKFEDGTPISAHDFVRGFEQSFGREAAPHGRPRFWTIEGATAGKWRDSIDPAVEAIDSLTFTIQLSTPDSRLLHKLALPRFAVPMAAESASDKAGRPLASGAYRRVPGTTVEIVLARNPHYGGQNPGYVDTIRIQLGVGARRAVQGLASSRVDVIWPVPLAYRTRLLRDPAVTHLEADDGDGPIWLLVFNSAALPTAKKPARQAVALGVNRESLAERFGEAVTPWDDYAKDPPDDPTLAAPGFDPDLSGEALARSGHPRGMRLPITVPEDSQEEEIADALLQNLGVSGIHGEVRALSRAAYWRALVARRGTVASVYAWQPFAADPLEALGESFLNSSLDPRWRGNLGYYRTSAAIDTLIIRGLRSQDPDEREEAIRRVMRLLATDLPVIPLGKGRQELFHGPRVKGLEFHPWYGPDWGGVWLETPS